MKLKLYIVCTTAALLSSCAIMHHIQVGNIDNRNGVNLRPIEVKVSEMGIDLQDAKAISKVLLNKESSHQANDALAMVEMFQMGPRTGAGVYSIDYITNIQDVLRSQCRDGFITGIMAIRETRKYPVISGEIVKIKAYCATSKGAVSTTPMGTVKTTPKGT